MPPPRGELEGEDPESLLLSELPGQEVREDKAWTCSVGTGEEEVGGGPCIKAVRTPRFSLGGTGGNSPPASDRDLLRPGLVLSVWLDLRLGEAALSLRSEVKLLSAAGASPELRPSNTVKQMDSWESLLGRGGAGSGVGQKWTGVVLRRLKTVLGLGTGFTATLLLSEFVSMAARSGAELFLNTS